MTGTASLCEGILSISKLIRMGVRENWIAFYRFDGSNTRMCLFTNFSPASSEKAAFHITTTDRQEPNLHAADPKPAEDSGNLCMQGLSVPPYTSETFHQVHK